MGLRLITKVCMQTVGRPTCQGFYPISSVYPCCSASRLTCLPSLFPGWPGVSAVLLQVLGYEPPGHNLEVQSVWRLTIGFWPFGKVLGRNMTVPGKTELMNVDGAESPKTMEKMVENLQIIGINHINWLARLDHHQVNWFLGGKNISSRNFCSRFKPGTGQSEPQVGVCQSREKIQVLGASPDL